MDDVGNAVTTVEICNRANRHIITHVKLRAKSLSLSHSKSHLR